MKRIWIVFGVLLVAMVGVVAVAEARGGGYGAGGRGMLGGDPTVMTGGRGMMGGGPGMMGGGRGMRGGSPGMMVAGTCDGVNYDPAAMLEQHQAMITQQEALLTRLQELLANTTDEARRTLLERNIEQHELMLTYHKEKLPLIEALPAEWLDGALSLAQFDVTFFGDASSDDARIQSFIDNRLARAEQRLTYLEGLKEQ